ncbi:MAG: penicillin-binding transpeptidase domain-containing protein [bacterium]|nr:penicillin-binding transpeptidase domain-containing protein [bacterium]
MFSDVFEIVKEHVKRIVTSRLFVLVLLFGGMFSILAVRLFDMQILHGEEYVDQYISTTEKDILLKSTRGNIYDAKGELLAYNELAYSVTIQDTGEYNSIERNQMIYRLVQILDKHGISIQGSLEIGIDESGALYYTSSSEAARKRFLRDYYGQRSVDDLNKVNSDGSISYPTNLSARELFEKCMERYDVDDLRTEKGGNLEVDDATALKIANIRYTMGLTAYKKYETTTLATQISDEAVADILEHKADLKGVGIEEDTIRVYNNSVYFAPIIGYTGKVNQEQLETLRENDPDYNYELNDIVGQAGIEAAMEQQLHGTKGSQTMFVDNMGGIREITERVEPQAGSDVYLSLDTNLQIAIYHILEQELAGIVASRLVNMDIDPESYADPSDKPIPIKDAYYQLINNNVLSLSAMAAEDASDIERQIYQKFLNRREQILAELRTQLYAQQAAPLSSLSEETASYMQYIITFLAGKDIWIGANIDQSSETYRAWTAESISLRDYLYAGIAGDWVDSTKLNITDKYSDADSIFETLAEYVLTSLSEDTAFTKRIFRYLVNDEIVTGRELCLALYAQEVLPYDANQVALLQSNGAAYAYSFLVEKVRNIELTPAQLALDPCTAGCVVTDVNTGQVKALVTYPSYDNNKFSGGVNAEYYSRLLNDLSRPLYNNATQTVKAPGSTFKPIMAIAGLEEGVISLAETIVCTGKYPDATPPMNCWIYPGRHGALNIIGGIENSCNYVFGEIGHRLSLGENGSYSTERGLAKIREYASLFGLDHTSGIEISESKPEISTTDPERSAIGQGSHSFANVQLARYVSAIANKGTVYELSLIDRVTDSKGNVEQEYSPEVYQQLDFADSTWSAVHQGMRQVISNGSARRIFNGLPVEVAGKTGTAQESKTKPDHALFVSFAPVSNPEIAVTVNIPNGYGSSNAVMVGRSVYEYYFGFKDLATIQGQGATSVANVVIGD